ncbi:histidine phosphatase family protein [Conexibacter arvalis]|uniref:Putative phosphoglycerate mutase n=1 Tax=Conexibacter arvalis TaxID=912552 RepID=A0A840IC60_9ACTN|nr:histidine phosphatase family protein [Conexibacter arvalis]MBB4661803.1 putative phosphoglycerate mutase [Conexibacter arvalis]
MHDLYVVTHPHAEHTERDLVGGWHDSRLTANGRRDAGRVATALERRRRDASRPVRVTTSDLARCAETAEIVATALGAPVTRDRRLREISFGEAEGRPNAWLAERQVPAPDDDRLDHRGPVAGAETRREVAVRVGACVDELMADREHDHVVVTHGFAQTFVITTWLRIPAEAAGFASFATVPGAITHLRHDPYWRNRSVVTRAGTDHLETAAPRR